MTKNIWYFDNLRFVLAAFVVMWHSASAYTGSGSWPISESEGSAFVYGIKTLLDAITMPLFFYIAGYFALPSLQKKGVRGFIQAKFWRILVPWTLSLLLIVPFVEWVARIAKGGLAQEYLGVWIWQMNRMLDPHLGFVGSGFYQRYMWFLSLLFGFYMLLVLAYKLRPAWFNADRSELLQLSFKKARCFKFIVAVLGITVLPMFVVILLVLIIGNSSSPEPFISVFNILQFQSSRLLIYLTYFILGILTVRNHWIERGIFDHRRLWTFVFAISTSLYFVLMNVLKPSIPDEIFGMFFVIFINLFIVSALGISIALGKKYWDAPIFGNGAYASHTFNIYILHYVFVYLMQWWFLSFEPVPIVLKFLSVSILAFSLSYFVSRYIMKPSPKSIVIIGVMISLVLVIMV